MTETPKSFADRPEAGGPWRSHQREPHTILISSPGFSESVRLRGEQIFCCAPEAPFAISLDHLGGTIHILNEGKFELQLQGQRHTYRYEQGDVILLPAGAAHVVRSGRRVPPRSLSESDTRDEIVRHSTGTRWLSGTFLVRRLARRPATSRSASLSSTYEALKDESVVWLDVSTQMLMKEKISPSEGSAEMISRILDLLFIQRATSMGDEAGRDRQVGSPELWTL